MNRILLLLFFLFSSVPALFSQGNSANAPGYRNTRPLDYPTPADNGKLLFFIQRNKNKNTIAYDAKMVSGKFDTEKPIDDYWLRYETGGGKRRELSWTERTFAYGYNHKKDKADKLGDSYWVTLTAYDDRKIHLEKSSDGKPIATMTINGKKCRLNYIYVFADESGSWPKVLYVDLHGKELTSGKKQVERIAND